MNERSLAHIEKIIEIIPIEGADKIVLARVLGWQCVVKKDEFKAGDLVVYCEVDSVMPDKPEYEFLRERKFRIRTIKLRGQLSQGLILPMSVLPDKSIKVGNALGKDVTELLGITKYLSSSEKTEQDRVVLHQNKLKKFMMRYSWFRRLFMSRNQSKGWPYWISKTDEERLQNMPHVIQQFKDYTVYVTEKIDYQSVTFTGQITPKYPILKKYSPKHYKFIVCSRNFTTNDKNSLYWKVARKYNIEQILKENPNLTIQGEQGDISVQGNKYGLTEPRLWVFNIIDHTRNYHYSLPEMSDFCKKYNLEHVPIISHCKMDLIGTNIDDFINHAKGISTITSIPREGLVFRCTENGQKLLSFKVINNDFLLKYQD